LKKLRNYHYSLRNNSEERGSHLPRGGSLKSRIVTIARTGHRTFAFVVLRCNRQFLYILHIGYPNEATYFPQPLTICYNYCMNYMSRPIQRFVIQTLVNYNHNYKM